MEIKRKADAAHQALVPLVNPDVKAVAGLKVNALKKPISILMIAVSHYREFYKRKRQHRL